MTSQVPIDVIDPPVERKPRAKRNGLAKLENVPAPVRTAEPPSLLTVLNAVMADPTASIERMNAAFDFYQRVEAAQARKAFDTAMAAARAHFDKVTKRHEVSRGDGGAKGTFKHEDLADIAAAVDPALAAQGLSYRFRATSNPNEPIKVTCVVTHEAGHFEETTLSAGADGSGGKNSIQAIGSTLSYLQRYSLRLALGIAAGREDDGKATDGKPEPERISEKQVADLNALLQKTDEPAANVQIIFEHFKVGDLADLTPEQYRKTITHLSKKVQA